MKKYFLIAYSAQNTWLPLPISRAMVIATTDEITDEYLFKVLHKFDPSVRNVLGVSEVSKNFTTNFKDLTNINLDEN